jgi:hypothetical protein
MPGLCVRKLVLESQAEYPGPCLSTLDKASELCAAHCLFPASVHQPLQGRSVQATRHKPAQGSKLTLLLLLLLLLQVCGHVAGPLHHRRHLL